MPFRQRSDDFDSCALIAHVGPTPTRQSIARVIEGLQMMLHRAGSVEGESDGCGIQVDVPRGLWKRILAEHEQDPSLADDGRFFVGHFFVPGNQRHLAEELTSRVLELLRDHGVEPKVVRSGFVNPDVLGIAGRANEPEFVQIAGTVDGDQALYNAHLAIERETIVHVVSLSRHNCVYKVHGGPDTLRGYYQDLEDPDCVSAMSLGHSRYSTNTLPAYERVQPFAILGHNGEINTVDRLRREGEMLGAQITMDGSDSQDLDRVIHSLICERGLSLLEAIEVAFPPITGEVENYDADRKRAYQHLRWLFGPFAQGPAGILARWGDTAVFSTDALGLRPLWRVETAEGLFFTSERGTFPLGIVISDPQPMAPGEKNAVVLHRAENRLELLDYPRIQSAVTTALAEQLTVPDAQPLTELEEEELEARAALLNGASDLGRETLLAANCWSTDDFKYVENLALTSNEAIGSLGYDAPLACLAPDLMTVSDYYKESVAVVTNPAMDREREMEHFSTRQEFGARADWPTKDDRPARVEVKIPVLPDYAYGLKYASRRTLETVAAKAEVVVLEDLLAQFEGKWSALSLTVSAGERVEARLDALAKEAVQKVKAGAQILVLDDSKAFLKGFLPLDPHLALAKVDSALRTARRADTRVSLRRQCSLIVRSGSLRNLHDLLFAFGIGADAAAPYLMLEYGALVDADKMEVAEEDRQSRLVNLISGLGKGLEKAISTMGTHELRGYGRSFASVGVSAEVQDVMEVRNFYGGGAGLTFDRLNQQALRRYEMARSGMPLRERRDFHIYPKVWKVAGNVAAGKEEYTAFTEQVQALEKEQPVSLRHLLDVVASEKPVKPEEVDVSIDGHAYPLQISSMSFGSQGETAFRSYAEAAYQLNIVCTNGEGGEIRDIYGKYWRNRGQQVASGRFGVNAEMLNSCFLIEIKIGQGAKPGEGGHLPGKKVTAKVAKARNASPGVDLISPSNNHDIYSIEDLAQIIEELKTINPLAKVSVKIPVVPGVGTIALGVAKAGADIVTLSAFDGGTGAARTHALKFVGMPVEVGVKEAHTRLVQAGIRNEVELWADGGVKTGLDVVKLILLGANRCGFGTLAMIGAGCTVCRQCQMDTCHVGIATQIEDEEEARHKGLKRFVPRDFDTAVEQLCRLFGGIGEEIRRITAALGFTRTQDMVGRSDLLVQARGEELVNLRELLAPVLPMHGFPMKVSRPDHALSRTMAESVLASMAGGEREVRWNEATIDADDRVYGTYLSGSVVRKELFDHVYNGGARAGNGGTPKDSVESLFERASIEIEDCVPGNGLAAFNTAKLHLRVIGGAQDGVAKGAIGGKIAVLKGRGADGRRVDGSVGKGFGYGAQFGTFLIQGNADSRFGIRLSGARVVVGGRIEQPVNDEAGCIGARANIKGFAFEYMTSGTAVVLGDPGPWMCAGMTGGVVYVQLDHDMGFDIAALNRRLGKGAKVGITPISDLDSERIRELLGEYKAELMESGQPEEAAWVQNLILHELDSFVAVRPVNLQVEQAVSTE